jgi:hypothetical protein
MHAIAVERIMDGDRAGHQAGEARQVEVDVESELVARRHEHEIDEGAPEHHARRRVGGTRRCPLRVEGDATAPWIGELAARRIEGRRQRRRDRPLRLGLRLVRIEPPGSPRQDAVVGVDDVRIAVGQRNREVGVHVDCEVPGDEVVVPEVVGIEEADERRVEFAHAAAERAGLAEVGPELHVAKPRVAEAREAAADDLVRHVVEASSTTIDLQVAHGLMGHRLDGLLDEGAVVVIGDHDSDGRS